MKTELTGVGSQYAQAMLELAAKAGHAVEEAILTDLEAINKVIGSDPEFEVVLNHPAVPREEKRKILIGGFSYKVNDLTLRLLELLTDKRRLDALPNIESEYRKLLFAKENIATATITSAEALNDAEIQKIQSK